MRLWVVCGCAVLFVLADAEVIRRRQLESKDEWRETSSDNLIDIDLETERNGVMNDQRLGEASGDGVDSSDDEDLMSMGSGSGDIIPAPSDVDRPPKADAGRNVVLYLPDNRITLCGNDSSDDHGIRSYQWVKKNILSADMMDSRSVCTQLSNLQIGDYIFTLVVTDSGGQKATADVHIFVKPGPTGNPQTPCQQLRETSRNVYGTFVPRCTETGDYDSLQCRGHEGTSTCWCADLDGREIPGTAMAKPNNPDCDEDLDGRDIPGTAMAKPNNPDCDEGSNLPPCVFMMVHQLRMGQLGAFKPQCSLEGFYQTMQCSGSMCYCVHTDSGVKIPNTEVIVPARPVCDGSRPIPNKGLRDNNEHKMTVSPPVQEKPMPEPGSTTKANVNVEIAGREDVPTKKPDSSNNSKSGKATRTPSSTAHIMTQPGILAAIIGGAVVLLLCAVLLVMFVVYRMRKKDEGSYALDEPKKMPNYSYQRAPDKEFYA